MATTQAIPTPQRQRHDMATFTISAGADDGYASTDGVVFNTGVIFNFIGHSGTRAYRTWYRFDNVTIPNGATINSALLRLTCYSSAAPGQVLQNIYYDDEVPRVLPLREKANAAGLKKPSTQRNVW